MAANANKGKGVGAAWLNAYVGWCDPVECLFWPFARNPIKGYGTLGHMGKQHYAHRFMCELVHGPAPSKKHQASHSCGKGHWGCVNPLHLSWATNSQNQLDRKRHGTQPARLNRLSPETVAQIRALKGIKTQYAIAQQFGIKVGTVEYWHRHDKPPQRPGGSKTDLYNKARKAKSATFLT